MLLALGCSGVVRYRPSPPASGPSRGARLPAWVMINDVRGTTRPASFTYSCYILIMSMIVLHKATYKVASRVPIVFISTTLV